jgi:hypothetical protein
MASALRNYTERTFDGKVFDLYGIYDGKAELDDAKTAVAANYRHVRTTKFKGGYKLWVW